MKRRKTKNARFSFCKKSIVQRIKKVTWSAEWGCTAIFSGLSSASAGVSVLFNNNFVFQLRGCLPKILKPILDYITDFPETFCLIYIQQVSFETHLISPLRSFCLIFKGGPVGTKNAHFSCSKSQYFHKVDIFRRALKFNAESFPSIWQNIYVLLLPRHS